MATPLCIFEDNLATNFLPLAYFRPVFDLRCGITTLREKITFAYPQAKISLLCRLYLTDYLKVNEPKVAVNELPSDQCFFINGRVLVDTLFAKKIPLIAKNEVIYVKNDVVVGAFVRGGNLARIARNTSGTLSLADFDGIAKVEVDIELVTYPWDLVHKNGQWIVKDFDKIVPKGKKMRGKVFKGAHLLGKNNIFIDEGATVKPGVVLDAEGGPIYIDKNARIFPNAALIGPLSVGAGSWIKAGAEIYENTTIGPVCKIGGEVEGCIIHGFSNKQHAGFLGHAYIGTWVNLGADTNNSDLKNNYSTVRVIINRQEINSGLQFVGLMMGDHSKSGINTMFNTGTVVGVCSNVFGAGFPLKYIPSFTWGAASGSADTYEIEKAIDVARRVMVRRNMEMSLEEEALFRKVFEMTKDERHTFGVQDKVIHE